MQFNLTADSATISFTPGSPLASPGNPNKTMGFEGTAEVLEFAPVAVIVADFSKNVLFLNRAAERLFNYQAADIEGRPFDVLVRSNLQPSPPNLWDRRPLPDFANKPVEVIGVRRNGSTFAAEASIATVERGKDEMQIFILRDISEQRQSDARNRRLAEECAAASNAKELLLTELRHRMRNNLQTILSIIRLEKARPLGREAKYELEQIANRILVLNGVNAELLAAAEDQSIDLGKYVHRLANGLRNLFEDRAIPLHLSIQTEPIIVAATTAARIGLLINEAVTNSFKHAAPKGATEISLSLHKVGDAIRIEVMDNGPGLSDHSFKHSGGMDLMQQLARQMGGTVQFDERNGMQCKIELPAV